MKTSYNVISSTICCAKEARSSIVLDWLNECNLSCRIIVKTYRIIVLNRAKKNSVRGLYDKKKTAPHSTVYPRRDVSKVYLKGWFTRHYICHQDLLVLRVNLSNTKNPAWFVILASLLDRGIQRVNWMPPRTIVARVFLKSIFRGYPIIYLPNGATADANTIHE